MLKVAACTDTIQYEADDAAYESAGRVCEFATVQIGAAGRSYIYNGTTH